MLYCCFIIETNPKTWKRIHFIPKYKQISKPEFWLYENLKKNLHEILTINWKTIPSESFMSQFWLPTVSFLTESNILLNYCISKVALFLILWKKNDFFNQSGRDTHQQAWAEYFQSKTYTLDYWELTLHSLQFACASVTRCG